MAGMENAKRNSVLVVDDEKLNLEILNNILNREYLILTAKSGASAIDISHNYSPDLILLDVILPDINGFDVLAALKKSETTRNIPVIIITGLGGAEDEEKGFFLKAADFIHKPFNIDIVKTKVHNQIQIVNQVRALEQFKSALSAAEEKSKFFAKMSHEMRTPLNAVIGLSELILDTGGLSGEARENVEKISNAGDSLLGIVNDILDISKIEEGKLEIIPVEYDTAGMINDTISQCIMHKGEKPIEFILNISDNTPSHFFGDDIRLKQILNNLLSNAFKYTKEGFVELNVSCTKWNPEFPSAAKDEKLMKLTIFVKDTGIGISRENVNILFSDYSQMDLMTNREIKGTGLGLSITKMMVNMMGGSISVESEYGKGSVFTVILPQKSASGEAIKPDVVRSLKDFHYHINKHHTFSRLTRVTFPYAKVLVVDDVVTNLDVAKGMMKPYRMQIDTLTSGQAAIDAIRAQEVKYNAVFMDHMMPAMDGIEATRIIREEIGTEYAKNIPIIAFTANALSGNEEMFLSKGFQAFISKPVDIQKLDAVLKRWVRDEEIEKSLTDQRIVVAGGETIFDNRTGFERRSGKRDRRIGLDRRMFTEKIEGVDIHKCLERFNGDWAILMQVIKSFSSNIMPVIKSLKEVNAANLADYAILVHGVKSSCRGISAEAAGDLAEALESAAKAGSLEFVINNNDTLIGIVTKLAADLECIFNKNPVFTEKLKIKRPYREVLLKLRDACRNFAVKEIETAMNEVDAFDYEEENDLVAWLRENTAKMNYMEIAEKLSPLLHKNL